jgi:uncharacterized protein (TIGR02246 family)
MSAMHVQHISVFIDRQPDEVYAFASDPRNLPRWAAGLARSEVGQEGDEWIADSPMGKVRIRFVPENPYGVLDHDVTLESGVTVHNPMRVARNGDGSEFLFTLFRQPDMSDEKLAEDRAAVEKDLQTLKEILERQPPDRHKASMIDDEHAIRELVATWMSASQAGDVNTVLSLMADDAIFMVSGGEPFGKEAFAAASEAMADVRMEGTNEIVELRILGDWAYMRCRLTVTMTPPGGQPVRRSGYTLSVLRKDADGRWRLARDANLLAPEGAPK